MLHTRTLWVSVSLVFAALAACSGNSSGVPPAVAASPLPTAPTPTPSPYPSASGDAFVYKGTLTQQFTVYGTPGASPSPGVSPAPTATPWVSNSNSSVTQTVTIRSNATFNGITGLTELDAKETDTGALSMYSIQSNQYLQFLTDASRSNGIDLMQVGVTASDSNGVQSTTTVGAQNGTLDQLPQVPAATWENSAARVTNESDPSGESISNTYAANGTYTGQTVLPENDTTSVIENADGSGSYVFPFYGASGSEVTISPVIDGAINITFKDTSSSGGVSWGSFPAWYPTVPPVLASDTFTDAGVVAIPSACSVSASIGTQATRIDEQRTRLDSIFGEIENTTQSAYVVPPYGDVCVVTHDDLVTYYDYSGQTAYIFNGTPLLETVTDETVGMQQATLVSAAERAAASRSATIGRELFVAPFSDRMRLVLAKQHLQFMQKMYSMVREAR